MVGGFFVVDQGMANSGFRWLRRLWRRDNWKRVIVADRRARRLVASAVLRIADVSYGVSG